MILRRTWKLYLCSLQRHPYKTNAIQTAALFGLGDFFAQKISKKKYDVTRTLQLCALGAAFGCTIHAWYLLLNRYFGQKKSFQWKLAQVAADQIAFAPVACATYIGLVAFIEGRDPAKAIKKDFADILIANYKVWPAIQVVNFTVVPLEFRVVFVQSIALFWNTYMSWKVHKDDGKPVD